MRHVHLIVIVLELHLESESIVKTTSFLLKRILEVANILTIPVPANALSIVAVRHFLGVEERFHALVVGALRLDQIHKVELISCEFASVIHLKVKPLCVSRCVVIILQNEIVFVLPDFDRSAKVTRFEATLKN